ncbi:hypothetical protein TWF506_008092 [Arthrobotrys conoides]|uniref:NB-ARC domain-containing protein n=1 Tax=Arthrobotrys conoides TaxID=74498 RepID=A0AAN8NMQ1_9PEZI
MSGFEIAGLAIGAPAVVELLIKVSVKGYHIFQSAQSAGPDFQRYQYELKVMCVDLQEWETRLKLLGGDLAVVLGATSLRYKTTLDTLAMIAGVFVEVDRLNEKYGISCDNPDLNQTSSVQSSQSETSQNRNRNYWMNRILFGSRDLPKKRPVSTLMESTFTTLSLSKDNSRGSLQLDLRHEENSPPVSATDKIKTLQNFSDKIDLEVQVPGLDRHIISLGAKAREYHNTLTALQRYKWAIYNSSKLKLLVNDLKLYTNYLHRLTKDHFKRDTLRQSLVPFIEFNVPFLPSHPLALRFCGRVEELMKMDEYLCPTKSFAHSHHPRLVINLHGMGGMGKSQLARHFVEVNKKNYTSVLWVHAADAGTVGTSARRILKELIAHYATRYNSQMRSKQDPPPNSDGPETNFKIIATDLRIPGQIDNTGEPAGDAAQNPWDCVRNWLARESNFRWCLVLDSVDTEPEIERLNELIPPCAHGHVIITSRLRVPETKIISVSGLDQQASIRLLLGGGDGDASEAEKVADALGHLPIALSQAAAYVAKKQLNFAQYLKRLSENRTQLLGTAYSKYTEGVFSCWRLSVEALMKSNPHAIDLLRLCSFLSPDGVSEELLHRGVEGIRWAQNEVSRVNEAVDGLVTYSLMTRNLVTASSSGNASQSFWIHPLVQLWARDSYSNEGSVILEENKLRLAHLHEQGARRAICLVASSLKTEGLLRTPHDWTYERDNVAHFDLCIHRYLIEQKVVGDKAKGVKLSKSLYALGRYKRLWGKYMIATDIIKIAIRVLENTLNERPSPAGEKNLFLLKAVLIETYFYSPTKASYDVEDITRQIQEILQRLKVKQPRDCENIIRFELLRAPCLGEMGDISGSLGVYQQCLVEINNDEKLKHRAEWICNIQGKCGSACLQLHQYDEAEEYFHKSLETCKVSKHDGIPGMISWTLLQLAHIKHAKKDYPGECVHLRESSHFAELHYGLAHNETLSILRSLQEIYKKIGQLENAEHVSKRIAEGQAALASDRLVKEF